MSKRDKKPGPLQQTWLPEGTLVGWLESWHPPGTPLCPRRDWQKISYYLLSFDPTVPYWYLQSGLYNRASHTHVINRYLVMFYGRP